MEATIKSIQLKKMLNQYYFRVTMESQNKKYILDNPLMSDPINFRRQVFGIMSSCNCFDIIKLARKNPIQQKAIGYFVEGKGYIILENDEGQWLSYNKKTGRYLCQKADEDIKRLIQMASMHNISRVEIDDGVIESIRSSSGVFSILLNSTGKTSFFTTGQIYFGFGEPINIGNSADESQKQEAAKAFTSFIVSVMKFYKKDDLLTLGGEVEQYKEVNITLNHRNQISSITNAATGSGFQIVGKSYEIVNSSKTYENEK